MIAPTRARAPASAQPSARPSYSATVRAADGVVFTATADTPAGLLSHVAAYVRARCDDVLWPSDAAAVHALADAGRLEGAIATYFVHVGERWDAERLDLGDLVL